MTYAIEKDIPVPVDKRQYGGRKGGPIPYIYPWRYMEIGDSFLVADKTRHAVCRAKLDAERVYKFKFVTRSSSKGVRVWRIE